MTGPCQLESEMFFCLLFPLTLYVFFLSVVPPFHVLFRFLLPLLFSLLVSLLCCRFSGLPCYIPISVSSLFFLSLCFPVLFLFLCFFPFWVSFPKVYSALPVTVPKCSFVSVDCFLFLVVCLFASPLPLPVWGLPCSFSSYLPSPLFVPLLYQSHFRFLIPISRRLYLALPRFFITVFLLFVFFPLPVTYPYVLTCRNTFLFAISLFFYFKCTFFLCLYCNVPSPLFLLLERKCSQDEEVEPERPGIVGLKKKQDQSRGESTKEADKEETRSRQAKRRSRLEEKD